MTEQTEKHVQQFETDHWYAIFAGWLIIPAINTLFALTGAIIMVTFVNPAELKGFDLVIYCFDAISIPLLIVTIFTWIKRKRIFPKLIIVFFALMAIFNIAYIANGYGVNVISLTMSVVWIVYFIRSKRVAETFIK